MRPGHHFGSASGAGKEDCHFLAYRYDARHGFRPETGESIVGQTRDGAKFFASKIETFAEIIRGERPAWLDDAR